MKPSLRFLVSVCCCVLGLVCASLASNRPIAQAEAAQPIQIWFGPLEGNVDATKPPGHNIFFNKYDFPSMLAPNAPWQKAASHAAVVGISPHTIEYYSDLPSVVAMINRYGFKIDIDGSMIGSGGLCEKTGMEGFDLGKDFATEIVNAIKKWKQYGGRLDYVSMDSPFFFGYYASANSCHYSIAEVARRTAATFKQIQLLYPDVKAMDADGPGPTPIAKWLPDFGEWLKDFADDTGHPMDAIGLDFQWTDAWHTGYDLISALHQTTDFLHKQNIQVGLLINANDHGVSESEWMKINSDRIKLVAQSNIGLDFVVLASWMKYPTHNLPETDPTAYTWLVNDAYNIFQSSK